MLPISVAIAKVDADYRLCDLTVLDAPEYRPHEITRRFWQGWSHYGHPALVTFNGRGYGPAGSGTGGVPLRSERAGVVQRRSPQLRTITQPLQHGGPYRLDGPDLQLRRIIRHRGIEPAGQPDRQAGKDRHRRLEDPGHARRRPGRRDQRLLPLRRPGYLLRIPPQPRAAGETRITARARTRGRDQTLARRAP